MDNTTGRDVAFECRFFLGDRPCVWHKQKGAVCTCDRYSKVEERLLVVKLDAMGDVLRTTALLPALAERHPKAAITWITRPESRPLLEGNPFLTEVVDFGPDALLHVHTRVFDRVINLDAGKLSAALATAATSPRKDGFVLDRCGYVQATNAAARRWLEAGVFDDMKRAGTRSYQDVMADILDLRGTSHQYIFELTKQERAWGREHLARSGVDLSRPLVGLNTGAGGRWQLKQWREDGYVELAERLSATASAQIVLLGGPGERDRNDRLKKASRVPLLDPGCDHPVRHFAALLALCDVVVTGDTLAMHLSLALGRRTVVLFGPTSASEIEMYGLGEKVVPDMPCLSCYRTTCDQVPNCMDLISTQMVADAVERQMKTDGTRRAPA